MNILIKAPDTVKEATLFIPVLKKIKSHYESVQLIILANNEVSAILNILDCHDQVITYRSSRNYIGIILYLLKVLKGRKFNFFINYGRKHLAILSLLKLIPNRIAEKNSLFDLILFNKVFKLYRFFAIKHDSFYNLDLIKDLNIKYVHPEKLETIAVANESIKQQANDLIAKYELVDKKIIFIHLDPGQAHPYWSSRNFARLIRRIHELNQGYHFVVYGDEANKKYRQSFYDQLTKDKYKGIDQFITYIYSSRDSFVNVIGLVERANLVIGHNSDITQLKALFAGKTIMFYNLIRQFSPLRLSPYRLNEKFVKIIQPQVICGEIYSCSRSLCPYYSCMSKMVVGDVLNAFKQLES